MNTKTIKYLLVVSMAIVVFTSCWSAKYRTYSIDNTGQIKRSNDQVIYEKGYGTYIRDFHLFYSMSTQTKLDTNQLKHNTDLLFLKVDKREREKYFKDSHIRFTSDTSGTFILNTRGMRDRILNCNFTISNNKCHIHYHSSSSKF